MVSPRVMSDVTLLHMTDVTLSSAFFLNVTLRKKIREGCFFVYLSDLSDFFHFLLRKKMEARIEALRSSGAFKFQDPALEALYSQPEEQKQQPKPQPPPPPQQKQQLLPSAKRARPDNSSNTDVSEKYSRLKAQMATLDRTLRTELERSEELDMELIKTSQERDVLRVENAKLKEKVGELYEAFAKFSAAAAKDREEAVAEAMSLVNATKKGMRVV